MNKKVYQLMNETLYSTVLANGLHVYVLPKRDFHKTYCMFSTDYGSVDRAFSEGDAPIASVPDGIAHFLEHKLFEQADGRDAFQLFGQQGASSNAYTSFTKTSYLFSATDNIAQNLTTLLDFVQEPYFTAESVEKEKGIIAQEIQMYDDDAQWQQFFGILRNLYPEHPLSIDIAGTVASIEEITAEDLYRCYNAFYRPENMTLFVVGNVDPEETLALIEANQAAKAIVPRPTLHRELPDALATPVVPLSRQQMTIQRPKAVLGIRGDWDKLPTDAFAQLQYKVSLQLLLQLLVGNTSANYLSLYNRGIVDDTFGYEVTFDRGFYFADFAGDTEAPDEFTEVLQGILLNFREDSSVNEEDLAILKKKMLGKYFQSLNSLEYIANQFVQSLAREVTLFDVPKAIESITLADVLAAGEAFIQEAQMSRFYLEPLAE